MTVCPTCGHPLPSDELHGVVLSPQQQKIFKIISKHSPAGITQDDLANAVYADRRDGGPDNARVTIRTTIYQLNRRLKPLGLQIKGRGGNGYRLTGVQNAE